VTDPQQSAWKPLVDGWIERERKLRPETPPTAGSVHVRDAVEVGDQAYVLISYDVEWPWPQEEDTASSARDSQMAVVQAERVRQPWIERDAARSLAQYIVEAHEEFRIHEHVLGTKRAFSGTAPAGAAAVQLTFDGGEAVDATVVDGWFLAVVPEDERLVGATVQGGEVSQVVRVDASTTMFHDPGFARSAGDAMYFSPLDLRSVLPLVQWQRSEGVVVVATCLEQYDEGGMLRIRIDGIRADEDVFTVWPRVVLEHGGQELPSAVCGEYSLADTISLDIGFKPWLRNDVDKLVLRVEGLRGAEGEIPPMTLELADPTRKA
jgi:hypothetical protein